MIDIAYQLQFLRYLMIRPSLAIGYNVANTRNAMPGVLQPGIFTGYQGKLLGIAGGYTFIQPVGAFDGTLRVDGVTHELARIAGVTEHQDVLW